MDVLAGFSGTLGDTYDLIWTANGFQTDGMVINNLGSTEFDWDVVTKDGGEVLQATVIPEPATMGLFALMGGGMLWIRCRFMI